MSFAQHGKKVEASPINSLRDLGPGAQFHQANAESRSVDYGMQQETRLPREPTKGREEPVSTLVRRDGAHQITVHDTVGREAVLITEGHILHITTRGDGPHLTPQMAQELADQLNQWAVCQQTVRTKSPKRILPHA